MVKITPIYFSHEVRPFGRGPKQPDPIRGQKRSTHGFFNHVSVRHGTRSSSRGVCRQKPSSEGSPGFSEKFQDMKSMKGCEPVEEEPGYPGCHRHHYNHDHMFSRGLDRDPYYG